MEKIKKMKTSTILLLIAIALLLVDFAFNSQYVDAIEDGYRVDAVVTRVKVVRSDDAGMDDTYRCYGSYEIDGKQYTDVYLGRTGKEYSVGDTMTVVVDPDDPDDTMFEGGVLAVIGFLLGIYAIYLKVKEHKAAKQPPQQS